MIAPLPDFSKMMLGTGGGHAQYYGSRPRYYGYRNGDDSVRFTIYAGGGATVPLGDTSNHLTTNYNIQAGMGPRFGRFFQVPVEFDWDQFGFTKSTLDNQIAIYDTVFGGNAVNYRLDGNSHIWSFSVEPAFTFYSRGAWGVYFKGGVGFYHKVANFTLPGRAFECYFFCGIYEQNYNIDHYTSNAPGYNGGIGLTYPAGAGLAGTVLFRGAVCGDHQPTAVWHHEYASEPGYGHQQHHGLLSGEQQPHNVHSDDGRVPVLATEEEVATREARGCAGLFCLPAWIRCRQGRVFRAARPPGSLCVRRGPGRC